MTRTNNKILINSISTITLLALAALSLTGCATIEEMGQIGPNKVYSVSNSSFLSSSQMIVVLNKKGDVSAYTGGTVEGPGAVGLQTAGTVLTAGAIGYAGRAIENGLESTTIKGIPSSFKLNANLDTSHSITVIKDEK
jgi:hypothetical protein